MGVSCDFFLCFYLFDCFAVWPIDFLKRERNKLLSSKGGEDVEGAEGREKDQNILYAKLFSFKKDVSIL